MKLLIKKIPFAQLIYSFVKGWYLRRQRRGTTKIDVIKSFPLHAPSSAGKYKLIEPLVILSISQLFTEMTKACRKKLKPLRIDKLPESETTLKLSELFKKYGSDKATTHTYYKVYAQILDNISEVEPAILEIGLGTNNTSVPSNMGIGGRPGASLRAFRDYVPSGKIYGADIDKEILFSEKGIQTFWVDQLATDTLENLASNFGPELSLIIDDGLHTPIANLKTFLALEKCLSQNGKFVVEDIHEEAIPFWEVLSNMMEDLYDFNLYQSEGSYLLVMERKNVTKTA
jgi:hypothetical protein